MKKSIFYVFIAVLLVVVSCKDESPKIDEKQSKAIVEETGLEMIDEMKSMETEPAMQANIAMVTFMGTSDPFAGNTNVNKIANLSKTIAFAPVYATASYKGTNIKGMLNAIQVNLAAGDPETITDVYDKLVGEYSWNASTESWDYVQTGTVIKIEFPSTQDGTVNNAVYTVSYTGYFGPNPLPDYTGDLPQNVTTSLKVDGAEVMSFVVDIAYNANGYPTSIESTLTLGQWEWYAMASNTNNSAFATEFSFKHASKILLRFTLDASGNWTKENIDNNYSEETHYYKSIWNPDTYTWEYIEVTADDYYDWYETETNFDIHKVITNGNASFQVLNLKMVGAINVLDFGTEMKRINETYGETYNEERVNAEISAINNYINLSLIKADNNELIASVEPYLASEDYSYETMEYNPNTQQYEWVTITETDYYINFRFVFADGSKVDAETYFGEGFDDVINEFETYLDELETTYGNK